MSPLRPLSKRMLLSKVRLMLFMKIYRPVNIANSLLLSEFTLFSDSRLRIICKNRVIEWPVVDEN
jgi:hypothetical protein